MSDGNAGGPATGTRVGQLAPDFVLPSDDGTDFSLSSVRGSWAVVYFYPADNTPGCTVESCAFRDSHEDFTDAGAVVIGISSDSVESHQGFRAKHSLPFTLLSDEGGKLRDEWGVKKSLGMVPGRVTYVIDPGGVVRHIFSSQVRPKRHINEALDTIRAAQS